MAKEIKIAFKPDVKPPVGYIPSIQMENPARKGDVLIPEMEEIELDGMDEPLYAFTLPDIAARKILAAEGHVWKLLEPESVRVMVPGVHSTSTPLEVKSIKGEIEAKAFANAARKKAEEPAKVSEAAGAAATAVTGKKKQTDAEIAAAAASSVG